MAVLPIADRRLLRFVVCGDGAGLGQLRRQVRSLGLEQQVVMTGRLDESGLAAWADRAHIGVVSLGHHRKGLMDASPLKSREYLARGLPVLSCADSQLRGLPWVMEVPPNEEPVDVAALLASYRQGHWQWTREEIRSHAREKLSIDRSVARLRRRLGLDTSTDSS